MMLHNDDADAEDGTDDAAGDDGEQCSLNMLMLKMVLMMPH